MAVTELPASTHTPLCNTSLHLQTHLLDSTSTCHCPCPHDSPCKLGQHKTCCSVEKPQGNIKNFRSWGACDSNAHPSGVTGHNTGSHHDDQHTATKLRALTFTSFDRRKHPRRATQPPPEHKHATAQNQHNQVTTLHAGYRAGNKHNSPTPLPTTHTVACTTTRT